MRTNFLRRFVGPLLLGLTMVTALTGARGTAEAFCCAPVRTIQLVPVDPTATPKLRGKAEINECLGMSFLHIVVTGRVPNGTQFIPVFRSLQPIMGDWFTMTGGRGETVLQGIGQADVLGKTLSISDVNFTDVLTGQF